MWCALGADVDVLVIGGGITGVGVARDAAMRGLKVALVEQEDLAYGTSSRSSKLIHGGLRYLEHYEFGLVFESVSERQVLQRLAPHLVRPLGFLFPIYKHSRQKLWLLRAGMWLYDGLSLFRSYKSHRTLRPLKVAELEPALLQSDLVGAPLYYDCATDDARLTIETALDAAERGAVIVTRCCAQALLRNDHGQVEGARVLDRLTGATKEVRARVVVNATGPWTDAVLALDKEKHRPLLRPTKGVHIVFDYDRLPIQHAVVCFHPEDERVLFAIPWGDRTYVGTTDTDFQGEPGSEHATAEDVQYLLDASNAYFPELDFRAEDVLSTWAGLRPLIAPPPKDGSVDESSVSREHEVLVGTDGLISIVGGKLTTYRLMSAETVDAAIKQMGAHAELPQRGSSSTGKESLPGAKDWPEEGGLAVVAERIAAAGAPHVALDTAELFASTYGTRGISVAKRCLEHPELAARLVPGRPEILAQVDEAVQHEFATGVSDILIRRTQLFFRDRNQGLGAAPGVAARLQAILGWDEARCQSEIEAFQAEVALSRRFRSEPKAARAEQPTARADQRAARVAE